MIPPQKTGKENMLFFKDIAWQRYSGDFCAALTSRTCN